MGTPERPLVDATGDRIPTRPTAPQGVLERVRVYYRYHGGSWSAESEDMPGWSGAHSDLGALRELARQAIFLDTGCFPSPTSSLASQLTAYDTFRLLDRTGW